MWDSYVDSNPCPMEHLIPQAWFDGLPTGWLLVVVVAATASLIKGADWLVDGASGLAYRLGVSKVIIGATVVSLGTTSPEAAVSVMAAWSGEPGLALGNAVGSVVADSGLIFGLGCLLTVLPADRFVLTRQGWVQFGVALLLALVCYVAYAVSGDAARLPRWVGLGFLVLLAAYMAISVRWSRHHPAGEPFQHPDELTVVTPATGAVEREAHAQAPSWLSALIVVGLVTVVLGSRFLVCSVTVVAARWGVPQVVIASTLVALGTSLPELATAVASVVKGHKELLVGNVIGADILNVLFVVGASAVAAPLPILELTPGTKIPTLFLCLHLPAMLLILILFRVFIAVAVRRGVFSRWMGAPLLAIYAAYLIVQFVVAV
jgi:cation:H+ antiporter